MRGGRHGRAVLAFAALGVAACEFDPTIVQQQPPQVVVHAVIDPGVMTHEILVERTLTGGVDINDRARFDTLDPINTGGGVPIGGATIVVTGPDGPITAREVTYVDKAPGYGRGRYILTTSATTPIRAGAKYTLRVTTPEGAVVTGATTVPNAVPFTQLPIRPLDRERDTVLLAWTPVPNARTYGLRVESPFGPFLLFTDTARITLPGMMRNFWSDDLQRLFIPGFRQISTVFAVDANYFDYYRSRNDPFTGSGIINHLVGGIGMFGSTVTVDSRLIDVTQATKVPAFEGNWLLVRNNPGAASSTIDNFRLWIETDEGARASLSGWYVRNPVPIDGTRGGFAGAKDGTRIELQFLNNQDIRSTASRFVGTLNADSIVGTFTNSSIRIVFRKRP